MYIYFYLFINSAHRTVRIYRKHNLRAIRDTESNNLEADINSAHRTALPDIKETKGSPCTVTMEGHVIRGLYSKNLKSWKRYPRLNEEDRLYNTLELSNSFFWIGNRYTSTERANSIENFLFNQSLQWQPSPSRFHQKVLQVTWKNHQKLSKFRFIVSNSFLLFYSLVRYCDKT